MQNWLKIKELLKLQNANQLDTNVILKLCVSAFSQNNRKFQIHADQQLLFISK